MIRRHWPLLYLLPSLLVLTVPLAGARGCSEKDCAKLAVAVEAACAAGSSEACEAARKAWAESCSTEPTPPPTPAPTPPEPTPAPTPQPTPAPTPTPTPPPATAECPAVVVNAILHGSRQYKAGPHGPQCFDATPRVCGDPAVSEAVGRPGQYCVPLGPECPEDSPDPCWRTACEALFNGGPTPLWVGEGALAIGQRPWEAEDGLVWQPCVRGSGRIKACDRAQRTCSPWVEVRR